MFSLSTLALDFGLLIHVPRVASGCDHRVRNKKNESNNASTRIVDEQCWAMLVRPSTSEQWKANRELTSS